MYLLYADESGTVSDPKQIHFVLAGISVFERQCYWMDSQLDTIASRFNPGDPGSVELHGSPMMNGRKFWRQFPLPERIKAIKDCLSILAESHVGNSIFACVLRKSIIQPKDPVEFAFEQLSSRFDYFLRKLHNRGDTQRGIIIFDKSTYETTIQNLATDFRKIGHTWDIIRNLAEVPLFIDSHASRLIQMADMVAYAIFRKYEQGDDQFFKIIESRIESDGVQKHGLFELINQKI